MGEVAYVIAYLAQEYFIEIYKGSKMSEEEIAIDILTLVKDVYFKDSNHYMISGEKIYSEKDIQKALNLAISGLNEWVSIKKTLLNCINNGGFR